MYRPKREQGSLFSANMLLTEEKRRRLEKTWAWAFRTKALPLIEEDRFRHLFHEDNGRPNKPVQTVIGILVLKEMFNLTDEEVLFNVEYNMAYHVALDLELDEAHCCQKTLHNFRVRLIESEADSLVFRCVTDGILTTLGVNTGKQRLDSSHILSNIAILTRLGLFCETIRLFLSTMRKTYPWKYAEIPAGLRGRYLKEDGQETQFGDAASKEARRRLAVCGRDVWRLVDRFRGDRRVKKTRVYGLLERLLTEQCDVAEAPITGVDGDADMAEGGVPVTVKESEKVRSNSLQTPHDPDVTYSGHKGKGYEVQVAETHGNEEVPEIITHVEVTRSCDSDEKATLPVVEALAERGIQPEEIVADTTFGSTENVIQCKERGTELLSPVSGSEPRETVDGDLRVEDFFLDPDGKEEAVCPAGHLATGEERDAGSGEIRTYFCGAKCDRCEHRDRCPVAPQRDGRRALRTTKKQVMLIARRFYQGTDEFTERYAQRAGIEATNSELKRRHGLGHIRTRGGPRVRLAVFLKAVACNVKRMVEHLAAATVASLRAAEVAVVGAR